MGDKQDVVIVIPAYNPNKNMLNLIQELQESRYKKIIVVNDGSMSDSIFQQIKEKVILLGHKKNLGKGRALKTAFSYCLNNMQNLLGVITVDADGQHQIDDINKVYDKFEENKGSLILGSRNFKGDNIPFRSKFGNILMTKVLKRKTKVDIKDTQTGLRAIPTKYLKEFINVKGERFDYETNMILHCINRKINIAEIDIKSIYVNKNKSSNYKVIKDSFKIYKAMIKKANNILSD